MKFVLLFFLFFPLFLLSNEISLSPQEKAWIKTHPEVKFQFWTHIAPYAMRDENGKDIGFVPDLIKLMNKSLGTQFELELYPVNDYLRKIKDNEIELTFGAKEGFADNKNFLHSNSFYKNAFGVFTRFDMQNINSFADLKGKKIAHAIQARSAKVVLKKHPDLILQEYASVKEMVTALDRGECDAIYHEYAVTNYYLQSNTRQRIKFNWMNLDHETDVSIKVNKKFPLLISIMNKSLDAIPTSAYAKLSHKWLNFNAFENKKEKSEVFTPEELAWIQKNPIVKVGAEDGWGPFSIQTARGDFKGLVPEYLALISMQTGLVFEHEFGSWNTIEQKIKNKTIDVIPTAYYDERITDKVIFSRQYLSLVDYFFIHKSIKAESFADLKGLTVAIPKGYFEIELIKKEMPYLNVLETKDLTGAVNKVLERKADLLFDSYAVLSYRMRHGSIADIVPFKANPFNQASGIHVITQKDKPLLASIMQKGLDSISQEDKTAIFNQWVGESKVSEFLQLSETEKTWLKEHPTLHFTGDPNWLPFEGFDEEGNYIGIIADYLKLIEEMLHIKIEKIVPQNWSHALRLADEEKVEIITASNLSPVLSKKYKAIDSFMYNSIVIAMKDEISFVESLNNIKDKKIVLMKEYGYNQILRDKHPKINFIYVDNINEGLEGVSVGKYDAMLGSLALIGYTITQKGYHNVKIVGKTDVTIGTTFYTSKNEPLLNSILDKAVKNIAKTDKLAIQRKWSTQKYIEKTDYTITIFSVSILLLILFWFIYTNHRMKIEIQRRREVEAELEGSRDEAQAANRSKSEFLANMSHEIRTPMNAVIGFAELLEKSDLDATQSNYLKSIKSSGKNLLNIINDILDISKIEAGKLSIEKHPVNIKTLLYEIEQMFILNVKKKGLKLSLELPSEMPMVIHSDDNRIRQVLLNLVGNAVKFTLSGFIHVKLRIVRQDEKSIDIDIDVKDSGIGIETRNREKIFHNFEQQDGQSNRKFGGTGLGLAISDKLAQKLGGSLTLESEAGKGSTFTLHLKNLKYSHDGLSEESEKVDYFFKAATVLVVDDVKDNRDLIIGILKDQAIHVLEAENGKVAVDMSEKNEIDLILMDIRMPIMNGFEATALIRKNPHYEKVAIIAVTASVLTTEEEITKEMGFDALIHKPILQYEFLEELSHYLKVDKVQKQKPKLSKKIVLDPATKAMFTKQFLAVIKEQEKRNNFKYLAKLSEEIADFAKDNELNELIKLSQNLAEAVKLFDIEKLQAILKELKDLSE